MTAKRRARSAAERTTDPWRNRIVGQGDEAPDQLLANPSNWRIHPTAQREALAAVLDDVGWVQRVIVNRTTQHVVDGHLRVALALSRDEPTIPVNYVELDEREEALVLAALDPIAAMAATVKDKLRELLEQAQVTDEALRDQLNDVAGMTAALKEGETDPDAVPDERATEIKRGDLFALGDHRLLCGDSTNADDVARVMDNIKVDLMFTDPPYGVNYAERNMARYGNPNVTLSYHEGNDALPLSVLGIIEVPIVVMTYPIDRHFFQLSDALRLNNFEFRRELVWVKSRPIICLGSYYNQQHEPILVLVKKNHPLKAQSKMKLSTVFQTEKAQAHEHHPTAKPIEMWTELLKQHSRESEVIFEPFAGSGTTLIAAEQLSRRCYAIEIEPTYCQVTIDRWEAFTGEKATKVQP